MRGALPRGRALHGTRLMPDVDVLVVGAGPAGAVAAREAKCAAPELDVALLERDPAPGTPVRCAEGVGDAGLREFARSEEHTSELQSHSDLVCRLLLEKKKIEKHENGPESAQA